MSGSRPYVLVSVATSLDGRMDDASPTRLLLSNAEDFDEVDAERARADAIMIGAQTLRRDDPRLIIKAERRRTERRSVGRAADPIKVVLTRSGDLDPAARFFSVGDGDKLVYGPSSVARLLRRRLGDLAQVREADSMPVIFADLRDRGVERLLVEGGPTLLTQLGTVDELRWAIAPRAVGAGPCVDLAAFEWPEPSRRPVEARPLGSMVVLRYAMSDWGRDVHWTSRSIALSRNCPPSSTAYDVGAVIVAADGALIAEGWSRDRDPHVHAEESALRQADGDPRLRTATLYSSLEPCGVRASRPIPCAELIVAAGIPRVVYAATEPPTLAPGGGAKKIAAAGITTLRLDHPSDLATEVLAINRLEGPATPA